MEHIGLNVLREIIYMSPHSVLADPAKQKEREERIRIAKEKAAGDRQKKLEELRDAQKRSEDFRKKQEEDRRRKLLESRKRDEEHRHTVEERRQRLLLEENVSQLHHFSKFSTFEYMY